MKNFMNFVGIMLGAVMLCDKATDGGYNFEAGMKHQEEKDGKVRPYLALPENLAPIKIIVAPLLKNKPVLVEKAREIYALIKKKYSNVSFDDSGKVGKVYAKADEIGVPKVVVIDFDTIEGDGLVSLRNRDDASQIRLKPEDI